MNTTVRVLVGIVASSALAFVTGVMMMGLSGWMDESYNRSHIYNSTLGFGYYVPLVLGGVAGFMTGLLFVITDNKSKATFSAMTGAFGFILCAVQIKEPSESMYGNIDGWVAFGPPALWMLLMLFYGIWLWRYEHLRMKSEQR
jgi:uncharacterized membrane protein